MSSSYLEEPLLSTPVNGLEAIQLPDNSTYIYCLSIEDRSRLIPAWMQRHATTRFVELQPVEADRSAFKWTLKGTELKVHLRSRRELSSFVNEVNGTSVYIDITGLPHFVWMPLVRAFLAADATLHVVYCEPSEYVPGLGAPGTESYELSDKLSSAEPIPGFASLARETEFPTLIALLGFEGQRFARVQERVQTEPRLVFPVVGIPGFQLHYPFITFYANRNGLFESSVVANLCYAQANCAFSALYALEDIEKRWVPAGSTVKVATIGTKPHSLGALMYFLRSERGVELIYDHPVRKPGRTKGTGRCWTYPVSSIEFRADRLLD